ncbi:MAG: VCBS repeat-containing protein [Planctomycetota bacterium]
MITTLVAALALAPRDVRGAADEAFFVDATLDVGAELLSWEIVRGLPGGVVDLVLAMRSSGQRELRVHAVTPRTVEPIARHVVPILADVIAWADADVRADEGRELVFVTKRGAWSYSLTREGYRDNVAPLVRSDSIYDMPDPGELPRWRYVLPGDDADRRDRLILPERDGFTLWGPGAADAGEYVARAHFPRAVPERERAGEADASRAEGDTQVGVRLQAGGTPFLFEGEASGSLLFESHFYRSPALVDVDGDGQLDLVQRRGKGLSVHVHLAQEPTRTEELPAYLVKEGSELTLRLHDLDGDGDVDILAKLSASDGGLENGDVRVLVLLNDGERLLPGAPAMVLKFEAAELRAEVTDVDGDGRPDLVVREFQMPSALDVVGGLEFTLTHLVYFATSDGFERRPSVRRQSTYDENAVQNAIANYELVLDCDGDGIADLAAVDLAGRLTVRRVQKRSRFLRPATWELEAAPWRSFETGGAIDSLTVMDINGDGLGDLLSASRERLTIHLSQRNARTTTRIDR